GGVSRGIFASMNLGFRRGDAQENVMENYRLICSGMGIVPERLVFTDQVHGTVIRRAGEADCGKGIVSERDYSGVDGHITNEPDVPLLVFSADCVPIFLYDSRRRAIGAVHAGWKGTVGGIAAEAVRRMAEEFGSRPEDIFAVIGPSAGPDCYEVGEDVADRFYEEFGGRKMNVDAAGLPNYRPEIVRPSDSGQPGKYLINLWEANRHMLMRAGLPEENIFVSGLCTICRQDLFFSHRATGGKRGSMAGFIMLRE
ncbi:MAG: peptidoglycan editing factor PgeF, partial [Lachnospiraceae bacterium]|nr:peptidoglycan editing factor PgeF [Lachnospiraceae bacterium]